ncbi:MAG: shikimate kinase [Ignisphaera sp.]
MHAFGGISIVNAIPSWFGGALAVNLKVYAKIKPCKDVCKHISHLTEAIVNYFIKKYSLNPFEIEITSEIPPQSGLKSSSAVAVAAIKTVVEEYNIDELSIPKLAAELSLQAGVSITGALDDAAASYYGGAVLTDNLNMKILRVFEPKVDAVVVIAAKGYRKTKVDTEVMRRHSHIFYDIFVKALEGNIFEAMKLNGLAIARILGYDDKLLRIAIERGALAAGISGNGPSAFVVSRKGDEYYFVDLVKEYSEDIRVVEVVGLGRV